jgi:hypothetical protein
MLRIFHQMHALSAAFTPTFEVLVMYWRARAPSKMLACSRILHVALLVARSISILLTSVLAKTALMKRSLVRQVSVPCRAIPTYTH